MTTIEQIRADYEANQVMQLAPAKKTNKNRHRHVEIIRQYQTKNHLLTPVSMLKPLKVKIAPAKKEEKKVNQIIKLNSFEQLAEILPLEDETPELREIGNKAQVIYNKPVNKTGCRIFFDMLAESYIKEGKARDIIEGRSKADKRIVYLFGRNVKMNQVIRAIQDLRDEKAEFSLVPLYYCLKELRPVRKQTKKAELTAVTELQDKAKARKIKLCEYVVKETPQLIPNASMTAQDTIKPKVRA